MKTMGKGCFLMAFFVGTLLFGIHGATAANRHLLASAVAESSSTSDSDSPTGHASASASATSEGGVSTAHAFASTTVC